MGTSVSSYDFSRHKEAMVSRFGHSPAKRDESWNDLMIILSAMEQNPEKSYALTVGADDALHPLLLDTVGLFRFSEKIFGEGSIVAHDPFAWGTSEFAEAWANTREAFAAHGIELPKDCNTQSKEDRQAEACIVTVKTMSSMRQAEACILTVKTAEEMRKPEACILTVRQVKNLASA